MLTTSIAELKRRLSAYLDAVEQGEEIVVTDRGRPVAKVIPIASAEALGARVSDLVREGRATTPSRPLPKDFWQRPRPSDSCGRSLEILREERAEGR